MSDSDRERGSKRVHDSRAAKAKKPKAVQAPWPRQEQTVSFNLPQLNDNEHCELNILRVGRNVVEAEVRVIRIVDVIKVGREQCP